MRVITITKVRDAMTLYPQWQVGLELWLGTFRKRDLQLSTYDEIRDAWREASGWNTDRVSGKRLKNDDYELVFDLYVFDVHGSDCRLLAKISNGTIFVRDIFSHAEYTKWCKKNVHQGKLKRS